MPIASSTPIPDAAQAAILGLYEFALGASEPDLYSAAIEAGVSLTSSEIGYIHLVNDDQVTIELGTWSANTLRLCKAVYQRHYPISTAGVWADTARHRKAYIHNDYQNLSDKRGYPEGHVHLVRHLGVPVLHAGRVVLLVGVGNKAADYVQADLDCLQALADHAWPLILQKRELGALKQSEKQLLDIQRLALISVWQWDPEEQKLSCDGNARHIFSDASTSEAPQGIDWLLRFIATEEHPALLEAFRKTTAQGAAFAMDVRGRRADGTRLALHIRGSAYPRSQGHGIVLRGIMQDITERLQLRKIRYAANHDALTGLANRTLLIAHLGKLIHGERRNPENYFAVHYIDLDRFKPVNDALGHAVGDEVLKAVAERMLHCTRKEDLVARIGGDELIVLQRNLDRPEDAAALAKKMLAALKEPLEIQGHHIAIGASIGVALTRSQSCTAEELLARADQAMYEAKNAGGCDYRFIHFG